MASEHMIKVDDYPGVTVYLACDWSQEQSRRGILFENTKRDKDGNRLRFYLDADIFLLLVHKLAAGFLEDRATIEAAKSTLIKAGYDIRRPSERPFWRTIFG